ncbi:zinc metallopeptidase [Prevotella sp. 10(H)]|uniref:zinc metallopeptidase n=1 Tax=Prevotella sp. 10(H) TaxID=1158294 RepID=UPI00068D91DD|nr:zinc metallopeptidase [Prevotella sp. 10(H)]
MYIAWILFGVIMLASLAVSQMLKSKFIKYSRIPLASGMTGRDVAEKMLHDNGIHDVKIVSAGGMLTDHYNPANKTLNLSEGVYSSNSAAAAAIAVRECGHAVQHANAYGPLKMRSALVPVFSYASPWVIIFIILTGIILIQSFPPLIWIGIGLFALTTIFSFITLPVEMNASQRALAWLNTAEATNKSNHDMAKNALKWAAYTYLGRTYPNRLVRNLTGHRQ